MKKYLAAFGLFIAGVVCALFLVRPAVVGTPVQAQTDSSAPPSAARATGGAGRYQMLAPNNYTVTVIDTSTGHVWEHNGNRWHDFGSPIK